MTFSDEIDKLEGRKIRTKWQFRFFSPDFIQWSTKSVWPIGLTVKVNALGKEIPLHRLSYRPNAIWPSGLPKKVVVEEWHWSSWDFKNPRVVLQGNVPEYISPPLISSWASPFSSILLSCKQVNSIVVLKGHKHKCVAISHRYLASEWKNCKKREIKSKQVIL